MAFTLKRVDLHRKTATWYAEYLQSDKWRLFKAALVTERGSLCEWCRAAEHYVLHHKTYARLFREVREDVALLCKECHTVAHAEHNIPFLYLIYEDSKQVVKDYIRENRITLYPTIQTPTKR